jgi:hypothetical protein
MSGLGLKFFNQCILVNTGGDNGKLDPGLGKKLFASGRCGSKN